MVAHARVIIMGFAVDSETFEKYRKAGYITGTALHYGAKLIKPGVSVVEVLDKVEDKIKSLGAGLAFPAAASINHIAAHSCSVDEAEIFHEGDVIKLDIGGEIDGFIGDTALTVDLSDDKRNKDLLNASKTALMNAIKAVKVGVKTSDIGSVIHKTITSFGFSPVRNLSGHGLDKYKVHTDPSMPNYNTGSDYKLSDNQVIAIEPFASAGAGIVEEVGTPTIFMLEKAKPVRSLTARKILKEIKEMNGLPFTIRWFYKKYPKLLVNNAFAEFRRHGLVHEFPPLADISKGLIAQFEHTMIIKGDKVVVTTKVDD